MQRTDDNLDWALARLTRAFGSRPGFPKNDGELELHAEEYLSLVHNKRIGDIPRCEKSKLADLNDCDWLEREALRRIARFYPSPQELRAIYCEKLPPADGVDAAEEGA